MNIGIYIYPQAEVLDFSGPFEVFSTASRICQTGNPFEVFLVSQSGEPVTARAGYQVVPHFGFHNHSAIDVLIVSGGVHYDEMKKPDVMDWIAAQSKQARMVASVCTGVFLLAQSQAIQKGTVTTHWEDIPDLKAMFPNLEVVEGVRWVDEGNLVTSGGISAGIDMSLHLVSKLHDVALAEKTAKQMDFAWTRTALRTARA